MLLTGDLKSSGELTVQQQLAAMPQQAVEVNFQTGRGPRDATGDVTELRVTAPNPPAMMNERHFRPRLLDESAVRCGRTGSRVRHAGFSRADSSSVNNRDRIMNRTPSGASTENPLPRPRTTSTVRWVWRQYSNCDSDM